MVSAARIRALVRAAPAAELLYSCLAFHGPGQGGELPGSWLVAALEAVGVGAPTTRQALFRLDREGHVVARRDGRSKWYRLSGSGEAQVAAGRERLSATPEVRWDGRWTMINAAFSTEERGARLRLLAVLTARGYGRAGPGLYLHPRDDPRAAARLIADLGLGGSVDVLRAERIGGEDNASFVRKAFPLTSLAEGYRRFLHRFLPLRSNLPPTAPVGFALRLATAVHFLDSAWDDPGLPAQLLPPGWPGLPARKLARQLYRKSSPPARRFAVELAARTRVSWKEGRS